MKSLKLLSLLGMFSLALSLGCSDDSDVDSGITPSDAKLDGVGADSFVKKLPANYRPYPCKNPGLSCNPHDACARDAISGGAH